MSEPDVQLDEQELRDAVRAAYQAFRSYKLHDRVEGCPCCVSESAERELRARPLREIEGDAFGYYVLKAMTTWGDVGDFKHFLPRILELLALDPTELCGRDVEIAIGKLDYAKWNTWPEVERAPVIRFFQAWWRRELHVVREPAYVSTLDGCLCAIGQAMDDLSPFLDVWRSDGSLPAQQNLARFIESNWRELLKMGRLSNAFWHEHLSPMRTVIDWLLDPRTKESLERAFFRAAGSAASDDFSRAVQKWEWIESSAAMKRAPR